MVGRLDHFTSQPFINGKNLKKIDNILDVPIGWYGECTCKKLLWYVMDGQLTLHPRVVLTFL